MILQRCYVCVVNLGEPGVPSAFMPPFELLMFSWAFFTGPAIFSYIMNVFMLMLGCRPRP